MEDPFRSVPIESVFALETPESVRFFSSVLEICPENLASTATAAVAANPAVPIPAAFCVVSRHSEASRSFRSLEHFIPEGLGYRWTTLPKGMGTCDEINSSFSRHEDEWLRYGAMGCLRPFYVERGKKNAPSFFAPNRSTAKLTVTSKGSAFEIAVPRDAAPDLPRGEFGPAALSLQYSGNDANSTSLSLAVHKMVVLAFWLSRPEIVYSDAISPVLRFLNGPSETTFRSLSYRFLAGAPPGVEFQFLYTGRAATQATGDLPAAYTLDSIAALARVHAFCYWLPLVGAPAAPPASDHWTSLSWEPLGSYTRKIFRCSFQMDGGKELHSGDRDGSV